MANTGLRMSSQQRLRESQVGPWGSQDGPVAGAREMGPNGEILSDEPMQSGLSVVRMTPNGTSAVDTAFPNMNDQPMVNDSSTGSVYAAGRLYRGLPA